MKVVRVRNQELDDPYCYEEWDHEMGTWVGIIDIYDPDRVIDDYILFDEEGWIYAETPDGLNGAPIDRITRQEWEKNILRMVGDPDYPSAEIIEI